MYIISPVKDYYDYLSHIYGPDKSITYSRRPFDKTKFELSGMGHITITQKNLPSVPCKYYSRSEFDKYDFKLVSICAKPYLIIKYVTDSKFELYEKSKFSDTLFNSLNRRSYFTKESYLSQLGKESKALLEVSRKLDAPVFCLDVNYRNDTAYIDVNIPILGDLGIASIYPPDQIYQDISYFLCNTIRPSPDTLVNDNLTSKEKIISHGFDLKQSFRHRV